MLGTLTSMNNTNSRIDRLQRRQAIAKRKGACTRCAPHGGENAARPNRTKSKDSK